MGDDGAGDYGDEVFEQLHLRNGEELRLQVSALPSPPRLLLSPFVFVTDP